MIVLEAYSQPADATLTAIAGLTLASGTLIKGTGTDTAGLIDITSFGESLIDDANASAARTTLGLGTIATQAANSVSITGGSISGITDLAIADGGTGASTAANARTNLELGTANSVQFANIGIGVPPLSQRGLYANPICTGAGGHYGGIYEVGTSGTAPSILAGNVVGVFTQASGSAQTYADVRGLWVNSLTKVQAGDTVTTNYGILVSDQTAGAANYAIHTGAGKVRFGDIIVTAAAQEATGTGTAYLGGNCPAVTPDAPYKWLKFETSDGSTVYVPAWK